MNTDRRLIGARYLSHFACLLLSLCLFRDVVWASPASSPAQASSKTPEHDYALIFGTVWGPDSRPVAGVPIKIKRAADKKPKWELVSDRNGEFAQRVPVGTQDYLVFADLKTQKGEPKPSITVHIDNNERRDVGLHLTEQALSHK